MLFEHKSIVIRVKTPQNAFIAQGLVSLAYIYSGREHWDTKPLINLQIESASQQVQVSNQLDIDFETPCRVRSGSKVRVNLPKKSYNYQ